MLKHRLNLFFDQAFLHSGWARNVRIGIAEGRIIEIETDASIQPDDERHACALPGLPNLHSHAFQRGMAGLSELRGSSSDSFWTWRKIMYHFVGKLSPEQMKDIAALAFMEMLENGFTRVGEFHYLHHTPDGQPYSDPSEMSQAIMSASEETGIALTLLPVFYAHAGFGGLPPNPDQSRFIHDIDGFSRLLDQVRTRISVLDDGVLGLAPHSLRAVTPEELGQLTELGRDNPIHIHIAEQMAEVEACKKWSGQRPVDWLFDHAKVSGNWCLVHATHITAEETSRLAESGAVAGICPITEANLGDGIFPAEDYLALGGKLGIGSDSNIRIDASEELRLFEYGQRLSRQRRNVLSSETCKSTGETLFHAALNGGAQALGRSAGLRVGNAADIVSLNMSDDSLIGKTDSQILDAFIFAAGQKAIDCVWRFGQREVTNGRHRARNVLSQKFKDTLLALTT
nr:formimidoylglutamate deiminase [Ponticaulis sp.]